MRLCDLPPLPATLDLPSFQLRAKRPLIHTQGVANKRAVKLDFELAVIVFPWCERLLGNYLEGSERFGSGLSPFGRLCSWRSWCIIKAKYNCVR